MSGKDSGLRIRVEKALRDEFLEVCHAQDRPAAQVIREFVRDYVAQTGPESRSNMERILVRWRLQFLVGD